MWEMVICTASCDTFGSVKENEMQQQVHFLSNKQQKEILHVVTFTGISGAARWDDDQRMYHFKRETGMFTDLFEMDNKEDIGILIALPPVQYLQAAEAAMCKSDHYM